MRPQQAQGERATCPTSRAETTHPGVGARDSRLPPGLAPARCSATSTWDAATKGLIFLGCLGALFLLGVAMDSRLQLYLGLEDPLALLFSLAQMAMGAPYFLARALGFEAGNVTAR